MKKSSYTILFITFLSSLLSLYSVKYHKIGRGLEEFEHLRVDNFRDGSAWDDIYLESPEASSGGKLNLNVWGGFHEVKLKSAFSKEDFPFTLSYEVELSENSYLYLYLDRSNEERAIGLRLSLNKTYPSMFFVRNGKGRFLVKNTLDLKLFPGTQKIETYFSLEGLKVFINEKEVKGVTWVQSDSSDGLVFAWGGSGELEPVSIDNILISSKKKGTLYESDFSLRGGTLSFLDMLVPALISSILYFLCVAFRNEDLVFSIGIPVNLILILLASLYYFFLSARYLEAPEDIVTNTQIEDRLKTLFDRNRASIISSRKTVLIYGGSNAVGVGAREKEETWAFLLKEMLREDEFHVFNFGSVAAKSSDILNFHENFEMYRYAADIIVILSGANDKNKDEYQKNIEKILNLKGKSHFILVEELVYSSDDKFKSHSSENYMSLEKACTQNHVTCLGNPLRNYSHAGILWTDFVHKSSYAHDILATKISWMIKRVLEEKKKPY